MIRKLLNRDIDRVADIWLKTNLKAHYFISNQYWKSNYELVKEMLSQSEVYVFEADKMIQGFVGLNDKYIEGIFVSDEMQSCGIGKLLLDYIKDKKVSLRLNVYQKNARAISFYQREGFIIQYEGLDEATGEKEYTIGVLVQSNFGATEDFVLNGEAVGPKILEWKQEKNDMAASEEDKGSIMSILATDLPLTSRQLKRILKRTGVGIARTGGYTGHGSGEVMIGFTTANRIPSGREEELLQISAIPEHMINRAFLAAAEAEQEAILNSMTAAKQTRGREGELYYSLAEYLKDREA